MSAPGGRQQRQIAIDANTLLALAASLEQEIQGLQALLAQLSDARESVERAIETIKAVSEAKEPFLVPADAGRGQAFYLAQAVDREKFIVHLGLGVYARLPKDKALEKLENQLKAIESDIKRVSERLEESMARYQQVQALLQQLQMAAARAEARQ